MPLLLQELFLRQPRKKPGPDGCERSHFLSVGSHASFAVDDGPFLFAVWLTSDRSSGFIFAVDELGESSLVSVTLYPFARELVTPHLVLYTSWLPVVGSPVIRSWHVSTSSWLHGAKLLVSC